MGLSGGVGRVGGRQAEDFPEAPLALFRAERIAANPVAHLGISGPTLEMLDQFCFGLITFPSKALLLDLQARSAVIAAAQFDNVLAQTAQGAQLAPELTGELALPIRQRGGVAGLDDSGQMVRQRAIRGVGQLARVGDQLTDLGQGVLPGEPVAVGPMIFMISDGWVNSAPKAWRSPVVIECWKRVPKTSGWTLDQS